MSSSQYNTCSALQRSSQGVQPAGYHPIRKRNSRSMCADFAAHGRPGLSNRECHWIAPVLLAAVRPGPWLRRAITFSPCRTRQTCQRDKVTGHPKQTKNTHTPATVTSSLPSRIFWSGLSLNSFVFCLSWLSCDLVPLARLSSSVRGVGNSRPEPWTRLHCSE